MADPLSLTASIIAVIGTAEGLGKTLSKIRNIRNAPNEILALHNEVSDLRITLGDVERFVLQDIVRQRTVQQEQLGNLSVLLQRAKDRLLELDQIVEYRLFKPASRSDQIKVSRRIWTFSKNSIEQFQQSLRDIRLNIITQMVAMNSSYQARIGLIVDEIHVVSNQNQTNQSYSNNMAMQQLDEHSTLLNNIMHSQDELRMLLQQQLHVSRNDQSRVLIPQIPTSANNALLNTVTSIRAYIPTKRYSCPSYCWCACHQEHRFTSPRSFHGVLGGLFVGYTGYPMKTLQQCTKGSCQARRVLKISVSYLFPVWFLTSLLIESFISISLGGIHTSLTIKRTVSPGAEVFRLTVIDDVNGLKRLFRQGLASPNDMQFPSGENLLHEALVYGHVKTCRFLLDAGADPHLDCISSQQTRSPFDYAWNQILEASRDRSLLDALPRLFPASDDYFEERQFSKLHKIVLGINLCDLSSEIAVSRADIDKICSEECTPLIWAARRGDSTAVRLLLEAKANPNICTSGGRSALFYAARSSLTCVKLLLEGGASILQKDSEGFNVLHSAAQYQNSKEIIECLVAAGADQHGRSLLGSTPLAQAALRNHPISAESLLDCGAAIDSRDNDGDAPLHDSAYSHSDDVMQLLLNRGANYTLLGSTGGSIFHLTAQSGGLRTLEILQAACLRGIDPDLPDGMGKAPLQLARERATKEESFVPIFQVLLDETRIRNAS